MQTQVEQGRAEAEDFVNRTRAQATFEADRLKSDAAAEATRTRNDAAADAHRIVTEATDRRDRLEVEYAQRKSSMDQEFTERRNQLISVLEAEHGSLASKVKQLREYEDSYRSNFIQQLQSNIDRLNGSAIRPEDSPELLNMPADASYTPQLDALLKGDQG